MDGDAWGSCGTFAFAQDRAERGAALRPGKASSGAWFMATGDRPGKGRAEVRKFDGKVRVKARKTVKRDLY